MKKILLSLVAFVAIGSIYAQNLSFGVKGGLSLSGYHGVDAKGVHLTTYHFGLVSEYNFTDQFSVQPEVLYSSIGGKKETDFKIVKLEATQKIDYISVPVLAKYYVYKGLALEVGPQFSYAVSRTTNSDDILKKIKGALTAKGVPETIQKVQLDAIDKRINFDYNKFDFALGAGLSYNLPYGFFASARYWYSFTNYPKESTNLKAKPQALRISLGYKF